MTMHTTSADWRAVGDCIGACHEARNLEELLTTLCTRLRLICRADLVVMSTYSVDHAVTGYRMSPAIEVSHLFAPFLHYFPEHPWHGKMSAILAKGRVLFLSDTLPLRALLRTGLWNEVYIHLSSKHQIGFGGRMDEQSFFSFGLNRLGRDYGPRERELMRFMRPQIEAHIQNATRAQHSRHLGDTLHRFFSQGDNAHVWVGHDGLLREISPKARGLLSSARGGLFDQNAQLPDELAIAFRRLQRTKGQPRRFVTLQFGSLKCLLLSLGVRNGAILLLEPLATDTPSATAALTRREAEILHWLGEGKSNGEIAVLLGISVRTVERHCGNIFAKLGVENRLAAALLSRHP